MQPQIPQIAAECRLPFFTKKSREMSRACPGDMLGEKGQCHRFGKVQLHVGACPLEWIIRQGSGLTHFGEPVPDRIQVATGRILRGQGIPGKDRIDDPSMGLEENGEIGPAAGECIEVKRLVRIGSRLPRCLKPRHVSQPYDGLMEPAISGGHATMVAFTRCLLEFLEGRQQRLLVRSASHPAGSLSGGEGIQHGP